MKKNRLTTSVVCAASIGLCCCVNAEVLPQPKTTGGMPLMQAMSLRCSQRDINPSSSVTKQELSDMLWAAWGITHDGKRTIGTAMNRQELEIYVVTPPKSAVTALRKTRSLPLPLATSAKRWHFRTLPLRLQ